MQTIDPLTWSVTRGCAASFTIHRVAKAGFDVPFNATDAVCIDLRGSPTSSAPGR